MAVTIITLPLSVLAIIVSIRQNRPARVVLTGMERLDAMAEALAIAVRSQWEAEEQVRRVHDPFPLHSRWTNASERVHDHWETIRGEPTPLVLDGHGDHILDTFDRIPSGRLVVLGRAGAGKTILTSRFVLTLLSSRPAPVPVIFSLGSWNPAADSLRTWLIDQLTTTYPILAEQDSSGVTVADHMLTTDRILPVLDGFDEIRENLRVDAINAINVGLGPGDPLLLTSRPDEYEAAVRSGDILTAAAVVRLEDLTTADLRAYLPLTTRKLDAQGRQNKWCPVLDHLRAAPDSPLAHVLTTPLMVALARTVFSDTNADPAVLLAASTSTELEDRLLAGFVPAVYSGSRTVAVDDADRWLRFLAAHLDRVESDEFAWWRLVAAVPRPVMGLVTGFMIALVSWLDGGMLALLGNWPGESRTGWLVATTVAALAVGPLAGAIIGLGHGVRPSPVRMRLRPVGSGRVRRGLARGLRSWHTMAWFLGWSLAGGVFGLAGFLFVGSEDGIWIGSTAGLFVGVCIWSVVTVVRTLETPLDPDHVIGPVELLRADRDTALRQGFLVGVTGAGVIWLFIVFAIEPAFGQPFGTIFADGVWLIGLMIAAACGVLVWLLFASAWGPWLIARSWLALTGRLPWSVMTFLADAHRRGVLRQVGGVYQFRHARLKDHLATVGEAVPMRTPTPE